MGQLGSVHLDLKSNGLTLKGCIALLDPEKVLGLEYWYHYCYIIN